MWSRWSGGVIAAMVAIALCAGMAVTDAGVTFDLVATDPQATVAPVDPSPTLRKVLAANRRSTPNPVPSTSRSTHGSWSTRAPMPVA